MKKFSLDAVLRFRQTKEGLAQQDLATALRQEQELRQSLCDTEAARDAAYREFSELQRRGMDAQELFLHQTYLDRQERQVAEQTTALQGALVEVEQRRELLAAASRDKRLLEKLRDKQLAEYRQELLRLENAVLDEIAVQQFQQR